MNGFVVDASVAIKWFLEEVYSREAESLLTQGEALFAPDLLLSECGNIVWKRSQRGELTEAHALMILDMLRDSPLLIKPASPLLDLAFTLATRYRRSVYDSLYLALAEALTIPLITADRRFFNALQATPLARSMVWIGDIAANTHQ